MIDKKYHIIISDDEAGRTRTYLIHGQTIITAFKTTIVSVAMLLLVIAFGSWKGISAMKNSKNLEAKLAELSNQMISQEANQGGLAENLFGDKIEIVVTEEMSQNTEPATSQVPESEPTAESQQPQMVAVTPPASTAMDNTTSENPTAPTGTPNGQQEENTTAQGENSTSDANDAVAKIDDSILEETISKLDARSRLIESVMNKIGIHVQVKENGKNSGGPYISPRQAYSQQLLTRTNQYINILEKLPLGRPHAGNVTSRFGWRSDPFLKKPALHGGIDLKGKIGDKVEATADGKVIYTGYDKGGYGYYIRISHDNNYESIFGHLSKILVKKGDKVTRKQVIGLVGNSGRSTGPHLHYELRYKGRHINPARYMQVADMVFFLSK